jgi:hypothetical protein
MFETFIQLIRLIIRSACWVDANDLCMGAWLNLTYVEIYNPGSAPGTEVVGVDNVAAGAAVPIPAAVWLVGSALAGLGWIRRKQTV